jgi:hypothetical protein
MNREDRCPACSAAQVTRHPDADRSSSQADSASSILVTRSTKNPQASGLRHIQVHVNLPERHRCVPRSADRSGSESTGSSAPLLTSSRWSHDWREGGSHAAGENPAHGGPTLLAGDTPRRVIGRLAVPAAVFLLPHSRKDSGRRQLPDI